MRLFFILTMLVAGHSAVLGDQTGVAGMHEWTKERGRTCMKSHFHSGSGEGKTKAAARRAAIANWQGFTAWEYGSDWASFKVAGSRGISYSRSGRGWSASVEARPCLR